jgi:outer membrane protein assembly factor BamB
MSVRRHAPALLLLGISGLPLFACGGGPVDASEDGPLAPVVIQTAELWDGVQRQPYADTLLAEGGTGQYEWRITSGGLPDGLALDGTAGEISGTPVTAGEWSFTLEAASGSAEPGRRELSLRVHPAPEVTTDSLPSGEVGMSYVALLTTVGGDGVVRWTAPEGSLPAGLSLDDHGVLTGFPEEAGSFEVPFVLEQGIVSMQVVLELEVAPARPPSAGWPGVTAWRGYGRDASRASFVPVTLDPSAFTVRWRSRLDPFNNPPLAEIVSGDGIALLVDGFLNGDLIAFDAASGARLWQERGSPAWGQPAVVDGQAYITTAEGGRSRLLRMDPATGNVTLEVPFENQTYRHRSPIVENGTIVTAGGLYGGVMAYRESDGTRLWFEDTGSWELGLDIAPAVSGGVVYVSKSGNLRGYDLLSGELELEVPGSVQWNYAPVVASDRRILVPGEDGGLVAVDPTTESIAWSHAAYGLVATGGGHVYVASGAGVDVLDVESGAPVAHWDAPSAEFAPSDMVLTDNVLFLVFGGEVHALDTPSWEDVWRHPGSGFISLSEGMLLMHGTDHLVTAIDLGGSGGT